MRVHWLIISIILVAALAVPAVSAKIIEEKDGYVVSTVDGLTPFGRMAMFSSGAITQGETDWFTTSVASGKTRFYADLNWGDTSDSITLTLFPPGSVLGPYYDSSDGIIDGRINIRITKSPALTPGTWYSGIYGASVSGSQSYTYSGYAA
jgi:hypothetical protein